MTSLTERLPLHGDVSVLGFDARKIATYEEFRSMLSRRELLNKVAPELLHDKVAQSYVWGVHHRGARGLWGRKRGNLIVNAALNALIAEWVGGSTLFNMLYCGVGSGTNAPAATDTDLQTAIVRLGVTSPYTTSPNIAVWDTFFGSTAGNGTWNEGGLFAQSSGGTMGSRALFSSAISKSNANTQVVEWVYTI